MKKLRNNIKLARILLIVWMSIIVLNAVRATDPSFSPDPPSKFSLTQDVNFYYNLNATDPDNHTPFVYSDDSASRGWTVFWMNNLTGEINFTPGNDDVGDNFVTLIVTDNNSEQDSKLVNFNVSNVNDPPNITGYSPLNLTPQIYENDTLGFTFNYNATDPDLQYGDLLSNMWVMDGINQTSNQTWVYRPGFCEPSNRNISLIVWDLEGLSDKVEWNVTVVNVNRLPVFNWSNPIQNITWEEDTNLVNNISLNDYFSDPDYSECNDTMNFSVAGNQNIEINISNVTPFNVSFYPGADWFGVEVVNFSAWDGYNSTTSNNVVLNVTEVSDPPELDNISNQTAYSFVQFVLQVNATDPDLDTLTYYDNTSLFDINSSTGLIRFTPNQSVVGNYTIMINVSDGTSNVYTSFNLSIYNNSVPSIYPIANQISEESTLFQITVNGTDPDSDNLVFQTNFTDMATPVWNSTTSARFSFTPSQSNVGSHIIRVTVTDDKGATNYTDFSLTVTDINNPPVLSIIVSPQIVKINRSYVVQLNATDADGDQLNFTHNASATAFPNFNMNRTGYMNFIANASDLGNHSVNITVWDITALPKQDSQIVLFIVTYNRQPYIIAAGLQNATEDELFNLQLTAIDPDNDTLTFYSNTTLFNISPSGLINFTPNGSDVGLHSIYVNVTDNDGGWGNMTFYLNITNTNDAPYFDPPLDTLSIWDNIYEDTLIEIYINATDEENDDLNFTATFLAGSQIFNISKIGTNQALLNFTPTQADVGNYSVNFTVSDATNTSSVVINFTVINVNDAPNITLIYPYGTPLSNSTVLAWANHSSFPNGTQISGYENGSMYFNHNSTDIDNLTLLYAWYLNGALAASTTYWNFTLNFTTAGIHNVTLVVSDGNLTDSMYWNLSVYDINLPPVFGKKIHENYEDFSAGASYRVNTTADGRLKLSSNGGYYLSGHYNSSSIDLDMDDGFDYTTLVWSASIPAGTNASISTRTSSDAVSWEAWSTAFNMSTNNTAQITSTAYRYIQYRINLSTTNSNFTPYVEKVSISYDIIDKSIQSNQDVNYGAWIDLDDFFYDPEGGGLNFTVSGGSGVDVIIQNITHFVGLFPKAEGSSAIIFTAIDGNGSNVSSNTFIVTVTEAQGTGPSSSSGGGTSVIIRTRIQQEEKEVEKIVNLDIIVPGAVTTYRNATIVAPITIRNTGEEILENINLSAEANASGFTMEFTTSFFSQIDIGGEEKTKLVITSSEFLGTYSILIKAKVQNPDFEDTAKIILSTLEKGELNRSQLFTKITFTQDLLLANPECLELNEMLKEAEKAINESRYADANDQIEKAIRGCRYLIASKESLTETPSTLKRMYDRIFWLTSSNRVLTYIVAIVAIFMILTMSLMWERYRTQKKRKKEKSR